VIADRRAGSAPSSFASRHGHLPDPASLADLKLLWLGVGNRDALIRVSAGMHAHLQSRGVPHIWRVDESGHDTAAMSSNLYHFVQRLFRE